MEAIRYFLSKSLLIFIQFLSIEFPTFNRKSLALIGKFRYQIHKIIKYKYRNIEYKA